MHPPERHKAGLTIRALLEERSLLPRSGCEAGEAIDKLISREYQLAWTLIEGRAITGDVRQVRPPVQAPDSPGVSAHGGFRTLFDDGCPENSLEGIAASVRADVDQVEVDVSRTRDGHWLAAHDDRLDIFTDGSGTITGHESRGLTSLRLLDPGSGEVSNLSVPDLLQVMSTISELRCGGRRSSPRLSVKVDVKHCAEMTEGSILPLLYECPIPMQDILLTSSTPGVAIALRQLDSTLDLELNTCAHSLFMLAYGLLDEHMIGEFRTQIARHGNALGASTVSLMLFMLERWGLDQAKTIVSNCHEDGFRTQIYSAITEDSLTFATETRPFMILLHSPALATIAQHGSRP
jgi:hypothetical protein